MYIYIYAILWWILGKDVAKDCEKLKVKLKVI